MSIFCRHPTEFQKVWPDIVKEQWFKTDAYVVSYPTCTKNIEWYLTEMFHFNMIFHALFWSKNLVTLVTGKLFRFRFLIVMNKGFMSERTIHILRKHIVRLFGPSPLYFFKNEILKISQKNSHFLTPSPSM